MITKYKPGTFILVPSRYRLEQIDATSQSVYMWLCSHINQEGLCHPSINRLAKLCHVSRNTVKTRLRVLERTGLITKTVRKKENGTNYTNLYYVIADDYIPEGSRRARSGSPDDHSVGQGVATNDIQKELDKKNKGVLAGANTSSVVIKI